MPVIRPDARSRPLVILPTYEEAENIVPVLESVRAEVHEADILVVDDAGADGTAALATEVGRRLGGIAVLRRPGKAGLGTAYLTGFAFALLHGYAVAIEMDSDRSHDPHVLPALLAELDAGADLAIGSRYVPGGVIPRWAAHRRLLSWGGNRVASLALGTAVADLTSGFRAYRCEVLGGSDLASIRSEGYGFQIEMAARVLASGGRVVEVPITFQDRIRGTSKLSGRIVAEAFVLCATLWWRRHHQARRPARPAPTTPPGPERVTASRPAGRDRPVRVPNPL